MSEMLSWLLVMYMECENNTQKEQTQKLLGWRLSTHQIEFRQTDFCLQVFSYFQVHPGTAVCTTLYKRRSSGVSPEAACLRSLRQFCWVWKEATRGRDLVWAIPRNLFLHKWKWDGGGAVRRGSEVPLTPKRLNLFGWCSRRKSEPSCWGQDLTDVTTKM